MAADVLWYIDPDGIQYQLNDQAERYLMDTQGFRLQGLEVIEEMTPYRHGADDIDVYLPPRELTVGLILRAEGHAALQAVDRQLERGLSPFKGQGTLRVVKADGATRDLDCRMTAYSDLEYRSPRVGAKVIRFRASDPFWLDPEEVERVVAVSGVGTELAFSMEFPIEFDSGDVNEYVAVENEGDVETYPLVVVYGPGDNPTIDNETAGKDFSVSQAMDDGDHVTIDMENGTVEFYDFTTGVTSNIIENISDGSEFWPLLVGSNTLHVILANTASGSVNISYHNRYQGV
jgi:hypothetical protein